MSEDARSTQFSQFAKLLFEELKPDITLLIVELGRKKQEDIAHAEAIIKQHLAQRAYDLVCHALDASGYGDVPDMGEWPLSPQRRDLPPPPQVDPKLIKRGYC